jgi:hypothetical protein
MRDEPRLETLSTPVQWFQAIPKGRIFKSTPAINAHEFARSLELSQSTRRSQPMLNCRFKLTNPSIQTLNARNGTRWLLDGTHSVQAVQV